MFYRFTLFIAILISILNPLASFSLKEEKRESDPRSSQNFLANYDFSKEITPQQLEVAKNLDFSLATFGRGDKIYLWFGHTALAITDKKSNRSVLYDYGIFSFDDNFYQTFAIGDLNYQVWATSTEMRYELTKEEKRDITVLPLNIPDETKLTILELLNFNVSEGNNTYLYHHYEENCSTRIRDIIDKAVDGQLKQWVTTIDFDETLRQLVIRHSYNSPFIDWLLNFLQSGTIDKPITLWDAMFLPSILEEALNNFTYINNKGESISLAPKVEVEYRAPENIRSKTLEKYKSTTPRTFIVAILVAFLISFLSSSSFKIIKKIGFTLNTLWSFVAFILSLLLLFMVLFSYHDVTYYNENIIFVNPFLGYLALMSLLALFGNKKAERGFKKGNSFLLVLTISFIVVKTLLPNYFYQQNWQIILTMVPLYLFNSSFIEKLKEKF
jgi:hypothetical protein